MAPRKLLATDKKTFSLTWNGARQILFTAVISKLRFKGKASDRGEPKRNKALVRFPFDQTFWFQIPVIPCDKWAGIFRLAEISRPKPSRSKFRAKMRNKQTLTFLLALVLCDDSEVKKKRCIRWGQPYSLFQPFVYMWRNLKTVI